MAQVSKMAVSISATSREMTGSEVAQIKRYLSHVGLSEVEVRMLPWNEPEKSELRLEAIMAACCAAFCVSEADVRGATRRHEVVCARHAYHAIAKLLLENICSLRQIGELTKKNHATVLHSSKVSLELLTTSYERYVTGYERALELVDEFERKKKQERCEQQKVVENPLTTINQTA